MEAEEQIQLIKDDPYLTPYTHYYQKLRCLMDKRLHQFQNQNGLDSISKSYQQYGIHQQGNGFIYREWAPQAKAVSIFGDFNDWNRNEYHCQKNEFGLWTCKIDSPIAEFSKIKCQVVLKSNDIVDRIPAWINYTIQNEDKSFDGVYVKLGSYNFQHEKPSWGNESMRVYECHIGMSGPEEKVHTFQYFRIHVLPKIHSLGYNVIQIMGVIQHPYYGSFGYHVSNFFSVSSRFGPPNEFKKLVDEAHGLNIKVIIDLVHSHAAKNVNEGINMWDGTDYQYFHGSAKGDHPLWDSRVFDYSKYQVLRFLLSNIRFWLEEYQADGFRFDGVTSMLYTHHGKNYGFTGNYNEYFNEFLDEDALTYLMLANQLAKQLNPNVILIAEDVSGFPGLCRSIEEGGIGFNYRLAMAIPDMWIKILKEVKDEDWDIELLVHQLTNRRWKEKCISYAESHDQALVGDKTLSMWLFDKEIYTNMSVFNQETITIFRGMALHKMIRLITFGLGGEGYLNFMGNEFGHPEWIDFPREGNNWSYHYCKRRWDLSENPELRYSLLNNFDRAMIGLDVKYKMLKQDNYVRTKHNGDKVIVFERGDLLFVFNWHCTKSFQEYPIYVKKCHSVNLIFSTDDHAFGGHQRVSHQAYQTQSLDQFCSNFKLYLPSRSALVFQIQYNSKQ